MIANILSMYVISAEGVKN